MTHQTEEPTAKAQKSRAHPYHPPRLVMYGAVRELTAGGSGNANEGEKGQAKPRP